MFNMPGGPEVAVILLVALVVLGPEQLPKAMRTLGQAMAEIRKVSSGFQAEMRNAMDSIDSTARETLGDKPRPSTDAPAASPGDADAHVDEVSARNDAPAGHVDRSAEPAAPDEAGANTVPAADENGSGPSAADRAAG